MIVIEDQFAGVVITDEDVDQLEVVGDLPAKPLLYVVRAFRTVGLAI
jgi:hypothetical protein